MTSALTQAPAEGDMGKQETPRWLKLLQEWKALAWPAIAALLATVSLYFGYVADSGETHALGIYSLDRPNISQRYVILGAVTLANLGLQLVLMLMVATTLRALVRRLFVRLPAKVRASLGELPKRAGWGWLVVVAAIAILLLGGRFLTNLMRNADAMILKPADEVGTAWLRMSLDQDRGWLIVYELLLVAILTVFVFLSWWILTRFATSTIARSVYGTWAAIQIFNLVGGFAFIYGASLTFQPYPVVVFSNYEQLCGKDALPMLLGSDDKLYAFLAIFKVGAPNERPSPSKVILYLPRTEVKWMAVVKQEPLHLLARYPDARALLPQFPAIPTNPETKPNISGSGATKNAPLPVP